MTWDDLPLTAQQRAKMLELVAIGEALRTNPTPNISTVTYSQAKAAKVWTRELITLISPALQGIDYVRQVKRNTALQTFEEANP